MVEALRQIELCIVQYKVQQLLLLYFIIETGDNSYKMCYKASEDVTWAKAQFQFDNITWSLESLDGIKRV